MGLRLIFHNRKIASFRDHLVEARHKNIPTHPVQTFSRRHQRIGAMKLHIFDTPLQPAQARMVPIGQVLAVLDHLLRNIDGIKPLDTLYKVACDITRATAHIKHTPWLRADESCQDIEDLSRIGRAMVIGLHHALVLKGLRVFGCKVGWFLYHLKAPSPACAYSVPAFQVKINRSLAESELLPS